MNAAAAYERVSSRGQLAGDGYPRQSATIAKWARAHHTAIVTECREPGVTGGLDDDDDVALIGQRPGLVELFAYLAAHRTVTTVVVERPDRLARDLIVSELLLREFRRRGVRVISADADVDLTGEGADPMAIMIRQILGAVAQFEKSALVKKLYAARVRKKAAAGRCEGPKPFGILGNEKWTLDAMRGLRKNGWTYAAIAKDLNAHEGYGPRHGTRWHAATVRKVLLRATA